MDHHMLATNIFTIGEIIYVFSVVYLVASNRTQFSSSVTSNINNCINALYLILVVGVFMHIGK
jgi:hypothetical protein